MCIQRTNLILKMIIEIVTVLSLILITSPCSYSLKIDVKNETIVTRIGDEAQLICSGDSENVGCSFTSPIGKSYILNNKFAAAEGGRIQAFETKNPDNQNDCAMKITNVKQDDR